MGKDKQSKRGVPRRAGNANRKRKYQTYRAVKEERCFARKIRNLVRHNGMDLLQAQAFWKRQKAASKQIQLAEAKPYNFGIDELGL